MRYFFICTLITSTMLLSCDIETAKPSTEKELIIASDYLNQDDTLIFSNYSRVNDTRVKIIHMRAERILERLKNASVNSGIDVVMLNSLYDIYVFNKYKTLHNISFESELSEQEKKYASWKYNYVGFGLDPYVLSFDEQNVNGIKTYNDLTRFNFKLNLSENELIPMLSASQNKMRKAQANIWIKDFMQHAHPNPGLSDSMKITLPELILYSKSTNTKSTIVFPNRNTTGSFYNLKSIAIVDQAQNYTEAKSLIRYFVNVKNNAAINSKIHCYSIFESQNHFRKYGATADELIPHYIGVKRVLEKL